jgi:hypothetical protein
MISTTDDLNNKGHRRLMPPPPAPTTTDPSGQLSTYLCLLKEAHMLGKTHVGNMRVGGGHMQERVMQMTDEV